MVNGEAWQVRRVPPADPSLVDRTGSLRVGTADPATRTISLSNALVPPFLDAVLLHEVAHAILAPYGLPDDFEEQAVSIIENNSFEAAAVASLSLGRPLCILGRCMVAF